MYLENTLCHICQRFSDSQYHTLMCQVLLELELEEDVHYDHVQPTLNL